jgi:uncharacterized protein YecE (DUF72 family)
MGKVCAGTSGWSYATWKPDFYPEKLPAKKFLGYYATRLNSVEVNFTFRRLASQALLNGWIETAGDDFQFAVKAHQTITHIKRLNAAEESTAKFLDSIEPLRKARKLGPVLFQLPPNFKCDAGRLREFVKLLPDGLRAAFEFRHESWFNEEVYAVLRSVGVALCAAETEKIESPEIQTAPFYYLRMRNPPFKLKAIEQKVRRLAKDADVYVYFKHDDTPEGALNAVKLLERLAK